MKFEIVYECQCCGAEVSRDAERDRGKWCMICFPLTRTIGIVMGAGKPCYGDCRERYGDEEE
tara:strand:- start:566 stop:751 length:186 start_codon:yes stop_codon:yes gene_type:complete